MRKIIIVIVAVLMLAWACSPTNGEPSVEEPEPTMEPTPEPEPEPVEEPEPEENDLIAQLEESSEELGWDSDKCIEAIPFQLWVYDPGLVDDEDAFGEAYQVAVEFCGTLEESDPEPEPEHTGEITNVHARANGILISGDGTLTDCWMRINSGVIRRAYEYRTNLDFTLDDQLFAYGLFTKSAERFNIETTALETLDIGCEGGYYSNWQW